jgi:hypothetical protein
MKLTVKNKENSHKISQMRHMKQIKHKTTFLLNRISSRLHSCGLAYRSIITSNTIRTKSCTNTGRKNNNNNNNNNIEDGASSCKLLPKQKEVSK